MWLKFLDFTSQVTFRHLSLLFPTPSFEASDELVWVCTKLLMIVDFPWSQLSLFFRGAYISLIHYHLPSSLGVIKQIWRSRGWERLRLLLSQVAHDNFFWQMRFVKNVTYLNILCFLSVVWKLIRYLMLLEIVFMLKLFGIEWPILILTLLLK